MQDCGRVHRFRYPPIAGVSWIPTRFVDEVPKSYMCGLCRMIPLRLVLLPCLHVLCQSCHTANCPGDEAWCPFDQEQFDDDDCLEFEGPTWKVDEMKVHCWNEDHGCHFQGNIKDMLTHYEEECTFHTAECSRCGEVVLHRELSMHYLAGCGVAVSVARTENASSEPRAPTIQDASVALQEIESPLRDNDEPSIPRNTTNAPAEHLCNQGPSLAAMPHDVGEYALEWQKEATVVAAATTSTSLGEPTSGQSPTEEASNPSSSRSGPEKQIDRKPDFFAHTPAGAENVIHEIFWQFLPEHFVTPREPTSAKCQLRLFCDPPITTYSWRKARSNGRYDLLLDNIREDVPSPGEEATKLCKIRVAHTRDSYFNLEVSQDADFIFLTIEFYGMREGSPRLAPSFEVSSYNVKRRHPFPLDSLDEPCHCKHDKESTLHIHSKFQARHDTLKGDHFSGSLRFYIHYS